MSGCGTPPGTCTYDTLATCAGADIRDVQVPSTRQCMPVREDGSGAFITPNFLYDSWISTSDYTWYVLERNSFGYPLGYRIQGGGDAVSLTEALYSKRLNEPTNIDPVNANPPTSFVFGNPPTPARMATVTPALGYTLTPDVVITGADYNWTVFCRDKRNNLYVRDSYNSRCTEPVFPTSPCNGDTHTQTLSNGAKLLYEFNREYCQWYLSDDDPSGILPPGSSPLTGSPSASLQAPSADSSQIAVLNDTFIPAVDTNDLVQLRYIWTRCNARTSSLNPACI